MDLQTNFEHEKISRPWRHGRRAWANAAIYATPLSIDKHSSVCRVLQHKCAIAAASLEPTCATQQQLHSLQSAQELHKSCTATTDDANSSEEPPACRAEEAAARSRARKRSPTGPPRRRRTSRRSSRSSRKERRATPHRRRPPIPMKKECLGR